MKTAMTEHRNDQPLFSILLDEDAVFDDWQPFARYLLNRGVLPQQVLWQSEPTQDLFGSQEGTSELTQEMVTSDSPGPQQRIRINRHFFQLARYACCHSDPRRFDLLYRILWRLAKENNLLLANATDPDINLANQFAKAVGRDRHKMKAFVRFRKISVRDINATDTSEPPTTSDHYIAWFEPEHKIVKLTADFFCERFTNMDWTILTPYLSAHWVNRQLLFSAGGDWKNAPPGDELEDYWKTYYANIFNPARLKVKAMCAEMPKKYWHNLPEAELIKPLIARAETLKQTMIEQAPTEPALPESTRFQREHWLAQKQATDDSD